MKYLLVLVVVLIAVQIWRSNRRAQLRERQARPDRKRPSAAPAAMTRCAQCDMHLPEAEALPGRAGRYCSEAHRRQAEG